MTLFSLVHGRRQTGYNPAYFRRPVVTDAQRYRPTNYS